MRLDNLEDLLNIEGVLNQGPSSPHFDADNLKDPFDLSEVHSQHQDVLSEPEQKPKRVQIKSRSDSQNSVIQSDSSFAEELRNLELSKDASEGEEGKIRPQKQPIRRTNTFTHDNRPAKQKEKPPSTTLNPSVTMNEGQDLISQITLDTKKKRKKKGSQKSKDNPNLPTKVD